MQQMHQHRYPEGSKPAESSSGPAEKALLRSHSSVSNSLELTSPRYSLERAQWSHGTWPEFSGCLNPPNWWRVHPLTLCIFFPISIGSQHPKWHQFGIQIIFELLLDGSAVYGKLQLVDMPTPQLQWEVLWGLGPFYQKTSLLLQNEGIFWKKSYVWYGWWRKFSDHHQGYIKPCK